MIYFQDKDAMYARNPRLQFIADRLGTRNWCVAQRLTDRLKRSGYERAVSSKTLEAIEREWEHANPDDARQTGGRLLNELRLSDRELAVLVEHLTSGDDRKRGRDARELSDILTVIESLKSGAVA
jgi:hypothetical protein